MQKSGSVSRRPMTVLLALLTAFLLAGWPERSGREGRPVGPRRFRPGGTKGGRSGRRQNRRESASIPCKRICWPDRTS